MSNKYDSPKRVSVETELSLKLNKTVSHLKEHRFFINNQSKNEIFFHKNNTITQTKYNIITFLPKALLFQFFRLANVYFLYIAIIQLIPAISPLDPSTAIAPLAFVIFVSLIREAMEDYNRYKFDMKLNTEPAVIYKKEWENIDSGSLEIGDLIIVKEEDPFPADIIVLDSNLKDGLCYIETGTLDGEKTLKNKEAHKETAGFFGNINNCENSWKTNIHVQGECYGDLPSPELYKFNGFLKLSINDNDKKIEKNISLDAKQILLKGINQYS